MTVTYCACADSWTYRQTIAVQLAGKFDVCRSQKLMDIHSLYCPLNKSLYPHSLCSLLVPRLQVAYLLPWHYLPTSPFVHWLSSIDLKLRCVSVYPYRYPPFLISQFIRLHTLVDELDKAWLEVANVLCVMHLIVLMFLTGNSMATLRNTASSQREC